MRHRRVPIARRTPPKRGKRPNRVRKFSLAVEKRGLWRQFATYVKERDGYQCFTCDKYAEGAAMHAGHLFTRAKGAMLFNPKAVHAQCASCNWMLRGNIPEYVSRFIAKYGIDEFKALVAKARETKQWTLQEIQELRAAIKRSGADYELLYAERYGL